MIKDVLQSRSVFRLQVTPPPPLLVSDLTSTGCLGNILAMVIGIEFIKGYSYGKIECDYSSGGLVVLELRIPPSDHTGKQNKPNRFQTTVKPLIQAPGSSRSRTFGLTSGQISSTLAS